MITTDRPLFAKLLTRLGILYDKTISTALLDIYWNALLPFDIEAIKSAFQSHVQNPEGGQYMPKPADVVSYLQGSHATQALGAWSQVMNALYRFGSYHSLIFDDPCIHAVISDMGGWVHLCETTQRELPYRAREFEKRYAAYLCRPPVCYPKQLNGRLAAQQNAIGNLNEPPLLVGDVHKAQQVYQQGQETSKVQRQLE